MTRTAAEEIERLQREVSLKRLVQARGVKLRHEQDCLVGPPGRRGRGPGRQLAEGQQRHPATGGSSRDRHG